MILHNEVLHFQQVELQRIGQVVRIVFRTIVLVVMNESFQFPLDVAILVAIVRVLFYHVMGRNNCLSFVYILICEGRMIEIVVVSSFV